MSDFKAKIHHIRFQLGLLLDSAGGAYAAPPPDPGQGMRREGPHLKWGHRPLPPPSEHKHITDRVPATAGQFIRRSAKSTTYSQ